MKTIAPDYYSEFKCIASACGHNCCHDWIIPIDRKTARIYRNLGGPLGEKMRTNIEPYKEDEDDFYAQIKLLPNGECPFLRPDNLCELVVEMGPDILCDVCAGHPRYCNDWSCRKELGLGLVCEEAARIILKKETPLNLVVLEDDGEKEVFTPEEQHILEVRDHLLEGAKRHKYKHPAEQRFMEYLIWHHINCGRLSGGTLIDQVQFVKKAFDKIIGRWHAESFPDVDALVEICRQFSRSVEHSAEGLLEALEHF